MDWKNKLLRRLYAAKKHLSGEEIAREEGVSRTAVWKAINALRKEGYQIESVTNRGYLLKKDPDRLDAELLFLETGISAEVYPSLPSTNDRAKKLPLSELPRLVVAEEQTMGKARYGKSFSSPKQKGVYFSLALAEKLPLEELRPLSEKTIRAVKEVLGGEIRENTLWQKGEKKAGVLIEVESDTDFTERIVIGVGAYTNEKEKPALLLPELVNRILKDL